MVKSQSQYVALAPPKQVEVAFQLLDWADGTPVGVTISVLSDKGDTLGATSLRTSVKKSWQYFAKVPLDDELEVGADVQVVISVFSADAPPTTNWAPAVTQEAPNAA